MDTLDFYKKNGYMVIENIFNYDEIEKFRKEVAKYIHKNKTIKNSGGITIPDFLSIDHFKRISKIKDSKKIHENLKKIFDGDNYRFCTHNDIGVNRIVGWHKDKLNNQYSNYETVDIWSEDNGEKHEIVKVLLYLQDHSNNNDGLKIVPGSHLDRNIKTDNFVQLKIKLGSVLIFDQRITHRGMDKQVDDLRVLVSFGFGKNNIFTDNFEKGTKKRQDDQNIIYNKKELSDFKNIHYKEDIYIVASGASTGFIDKDFFSNKITIGINQIYKWVNTKYLVRKETKLLNDVLKEVNKDTIHFISRGNSGNSDSQNLEIKNKLYSDNKNVIIFNHNTNKLSMPDNIPNDGLVVSFSTIVSGIHLAAYMGAKNIILVGHDCGTIDGIPNVEGYHNDSSYKIVWKKGKEDYIKWLPKIENDTIKLKKILKEKYNVNVYSLNPFINFNLEGHKYEK